ncbi:MAG: hypothetical protein ACT4P4_13260 [Betaproteobacteria bacterium]
MAAAGFEQLDLVDRGNGEAGRRFEQREPARPRHLSDDDIVPAQGGRGRALRDSVLLPGEEILQAHATARVGVHDLDRAEGRVEARLQVLAQQRIEPRLAAQVRRRRRDADEGGVPNVRAARLGRPAVEKPRHEELDVRRVPA